MASDSSSSSTPKPAAIDDRLMAASTPDEDDASRDDRRSTDGADRPAGQASDSSYLQSTHQGGFEVGDEGAPQEAQDPSDDGVVYADEDADSVSLGAMGGEFMYDAGALFPDLDMSGPTSFAVEGPEWLAVDAGTGLLTGAPAAADVGVQAFTVTATDAGGARFTTTLQFTVEAQDGAPVVVDVLVAPSSDEPSAEQREAPEAPAQDAASGAPSDEEPVAAPDDSAAGDPPAADPAADSAPSVDSELEDGELDAAPEAPAEEAPVQNSAPPAVEAPVAEQPSAEEPSAPPADPEEPPVQDAAPPAPEAPPAVQPPVAEEPSAPLADPETLPVQDAAPPAPEAPPAVQPPVAEEPSAPPSDPEAPPVQDAAPPAPEAPPAVQPPVAEEPSAPPSDPEAPPVQDAAPDAPSEAEPPVAEEPDAPPSDPETPPVQDAAPDAPPAPEPEPPVAEEPVEPQPAPEPVDAAPVSPVEPSEPPKTYNVITGTKNADVLVGTSGDDQITGGRGNDKMQGGAGDDQYVYTNGKNGADVFDDGKAGDGYDVVVASEAQVVIGVDGYNDGRSFTKNGVTVTSTGVDEFQGAGDTIVRDGNGSRTLNFSNTEINGVLEVDAAGGNDKVIASDLSDASYRGGAGNDTLTAGDAKATWLYAGSNNGSDKFVNGDGYSEALAQGEGVVIGVNGYANGVDAFQGAGDTVIRDGNGSRTLDFSNTELNGVLEVDARGGNDKVIASDLSDASYRGGSGNDALTAGSKATTWLYGAGDNGYDSFTNGSGLTVAQAEGEGVTIGVNGFANGVDAFEGTGDTKIQDSNSSRTLNFSDTELNGVLEVDARGGNDKVIASDLSDASYRGGSGNDSLTAGSARATWLYGAGDNGFDAFTNGSGVSVAEAQGEGVVIGLNGYADGVDGFRGAGDTVLRDSNSSHTLDFSNTAFKDVAEVDAGGGNDKVIASDLSEAAYRGGAGNDTLVAGEQRTVFVYGAGNNGYDTLTNGAGDSLAQAEGEGVVIGVNGYADGVDGFLGAGDTIIRDSNSSHTLDFSDTALKGVAEIDAGGGNDKITVSNLSESTYRGGAGNDVFVVQKGAASAVIADFDDSDSDRIDLSAFGSSRGDVQSATSLVDADGDGQVNDVQIDLGALGGEQGATLTLLDTDLSSLNFAKGGDFTVAGDKGAAFAKGQELMAAEGDVDQLFAFDMDTLDASSGWTAALDGTAPDAGADFLDVGGDSSGVIVFEDGAENVQSGINDAQWG